MKLVSVILCGSETQSLTLKENSKLRRFENSLLRAVFGPNRYEVTKC
jgi:hypothetical protein